MEALLKNKTAIITGATSGIGREIAIQFAKEGANVVVTGRREENLVSLAEEIRPFGGCAYLAGSGEDSHFAETLFHFALDTFGRVDILVYSAGMLKMARHDECAMPVPNREVIQRECP